MEKQITILTTEEAAKRLGISRQGLAHHVRAGHIRPMKNIKSKYKFFTEEEIDRYKRKR